MTRRGVAVIATTELRRRWRDRSLLVQGVLGPLVLAFVVSLVFGGSGSGDFEVGVADRDRSEVSSALVEGLVAGTSEPDDGLDVEVLDPDDDVTRFVEDDDTADVVIVVPEGFGETSGSPDAAPLEVHSAENAFDAEVAESIARGLAARVDRTRLAVAAAAAAGVPGSGAEAAATIAATPAAIEVEGLEPGGGDYSAASYFAPSMAAFFLYFTLGAGAASLIADRRAGVLARIRAAPVGDDTILWGRTASVLATGFVAVVIVWLASIPLMDADWGPPAPVVVVIASLVAAVAGLSMLVSAYARTDSQVTNGVAIIGFGMALLGGTFFSPADLPPALARVSLLTPNGLAQRAFTELSLGTATLAELWWVPAALWAWAVLAGGTALVTLRRRLLQ